MSGCEAEACVRKFNFSSAMIHNFKNLSKILIRALNSLLVVQNIFFHQEFCISTKTRIQFVLLAARKDAFLANANYGWHLQLGESDG